MSVPPRGRLLSVLEAERLEADGTEPYRYLVAYGVCGTASAVHRA